VSFRLVGFLQGICWSALSYRATLSTFSHGQVLGSLT
jgi:hypothetical protein